MGLNDATPAQWDLSTAAVKNSSTKNQRWLFNPEELTKTPPESNTEMEDVVNSPSHYNTGGIEAIQAIEASMSKDAYQGYLKGNCMKYLWRMSYKGKAKEDLLKAQWYLNRLIETL